MLRCKMMDNYAFPTAPEDEEISLKVVCTHIRYIQRDIGKIEKHLVALNGKADNQGGRISNLEGRWKGLKYAAYAAVILGGGGGIAALTNFLGG